MCDGVCVCATLGTACVDEVVSRGTHGVLSDRMCVRTAAAAAVLSDWAVRVRVCE